MGFIFYVNISFYVLDLIFFLGGLSCMGSLTLLQIDLMAVSFPVFLHYITIYLYLHFM